MTLHFDFDIDAGRQFQLLQGIYGFAGRVQDVNKSFVRTRLELFTGFLVDVRRSIHRVQTSLGRKRNRAGNNRARRANSLDDLFRRLIDQVVIE